METRVCVVGAGPSGMSAVYNFGQMDNPPEVVCYEKQSDWGGMWNFTWRTGIDEFGEPCHGGMYRHLFANNPKECLEYPEYTFDEHFGKAIPSYSPREVVRDYMEGRWTRPSKRDLKTMVTFNHAVRNIRYDKTGDRFFVTARDLKSKTDKYETFTHVIIATGIFNRPNIPYFDGIDTFPGRIIHSHDFRNANEFENQRILVVGSSYSAEDMALQPMKYGAKSAICSWRTKPMGFKWPKGIEERPLVQNIHNNTVTFKDGSKAEVDAIILATGYLLHFAFLDNDLRLESTCNLYPNNLYKGILWTNGGNRKLFYIGVQDQYFSFTMFEAQALWACKYIMGTLPKQVTSVSDDAMKAHNAEWIKRKETLTNRHEEIDFQTDHFEDLCEDSGYNKDAPKAGKLYHAWLDIRKDNFPTFRDQSFVSVYTGTKSPKPKCPWFQEKDDTFDAFVKHDYK